LLRGFAESDWIAQILLETIVEVAFGMEKFVD